MNDSKVTNDWWNIFRYFPPEPNALRRLYLFLMFTTIVLFMASAICAFLVHGSLFNELDINYNDCNCVKQSNYLQELRIKENEKKESAKRRSDKLKGIRYDSESKNFNQQWDWFESELSKLEKIEKARSKYRIPSISEDFLFFMLPLILLSLIFYPLLSRLITLHSRSIFRNSILKIAKQEYICGWKTPYLIFGLLFVSTMIISDLMTSVYASEKSWFGYESFCVTPYSFIIECFGLGALAFVSSTPFTILWCLSRSEYIPYPDLTAKDGKLGAGRYVEFLQTWTLWLTLAPSTFGILYFRFIFEMEPEFSKIRFLYALGIGVVVIMIVIRLIKNAIVLRFRCNEVLLNLSGEESSIKQNDPTINFLGTEWWKLPATISISLGTIWALLEFSGLLKIIINIFKID